MLSFTIRFLILIKERISRTSAPGTYIPSSEQERNSRASLLQSTASVLRSFSLLMLDADNLQANIFLGNYYYLQAEKDKKKLEEDYKKITSPTRMQYARYRNGLSDVFTNSYGKAKAYLQRVLQVFPSMEAGNTLEKIKKMELELK